MMRKLTKYTLLISVVFISYGCAFSALKNTCIDIEGGVKCATIEENLKYMDNKTKSSQTIDNLSVVDTENDVFKDEIVRLMTSQSIDRSTTTIPTKVYQGRYRLMILPYTDKDKYYSGRYVYITAGREHWVVDDYVMSEKTPIKINVPLKKSKQKKDIDFKNKLKLKDRSDVELINFYTVSAFSGLNCRDYPDQNSMIVRSYNYGDELEVIDTTSPYWFKIKDGDIDCFVNSNYLDNRYMK